ncbi:MAG: hypothetical protein AUJ74_00990 [Candidatus Omnitrophica bacterium CG1_02_44_16]|nr:MAG: hypothetical protein AUJ74_00990 [Candidatus Omnitrophica bacterium CG1_02_44_16]PIY82672.1 MAG: hypothetical protein COY78_05215 [Candidatus Omnitrophica bacterium CG_4_10_14_0_8_um_filter_44_12]PIZ84832.1 MAG: hypothetical protein COX96_01485 [Candidatus Omnitrophica bacterium CG_4_10_14_0_2_um_filter_44_9]
MSHVKKLFSAGQSVLEYAMLLAIVSAAFITMAVYVRRAMQGQLYQIEKRTVAKAEVNTYATSDGCPPMCI